MAKMGMWRYISVGFVATVLLVTYMSGSSEKTLQEDRLKDEYIHLDDNISITGEKAEGTTKSRDISSGYSTLSSSSISLQNKTETVGIGTSSIGTAAVSTNAPEVANTSPTASDTTSGVNPMQTPKVTESPQSTLTKLLLTSTVLTTKFQLEDVTTVNTETPESGNNMGNTPEGSGNTDQILGEDKVTKSQSTTKDAAEVFTTQTDIAIHTTTEERTVPQVNNPDANLTSNYTTHQQSETTETTTRTTTGGQDVENISKLTTSELKDVSQTPPTPAPPAAIATITTTTQSATERVENKTSLTTTNITQNSTTLSSILLQTMSAVQQSTPPPE